MEISYRASSNDPILRPYNCNSLLNGRYRQNNLKRHLNLTSCFVRPKVECKYCKKIVRNKRSLDYHIMNNHQQLTRII